MIYLELFLGFLKVGFFTFGGSYGAIPLIRDVVLSHGWLSDETLTYMIAVSESTPGPIMVNMATYIGSNQAGFLGAVVATVAVALPAFAVILLLTALLKSAMKNRWVQAAMNGLTPCVVGIVLATGLFLLLEGCLGTVRTPQLDLRALALTAILLAAGPLYRRLTKKPLSPIVLILLSAALGAGAYGIF